MFFCLLIAAVLFPGCGETKTDDSSTQENGQSTQTGKQLSLNQPVEFGGATFVFTSAEELDSIPVAFEDDETYTPEKGKYVVVYFTFQGAEGNEMGGIDLAIFKLADRQGNVYYMDTDLANYEANDLALEEDLAIPSMLMWSNPEGKDSALVFDVNPDTDGFSLQLRQQDASGETVPIATVDLGI